MATSFKTRFPLIYSKDNPTENLSRIQEWLKKESYEHAHHLDLPDLQKRIQTELEAIFISALNEAIENSDVDEFEQILMMIERMPARSSRRMQISMNENLENNLLNRFSLPLIIVAAKYLKCHFSQRLINVAYISNMDFYMAEIQYILGQNSKMSLRLLQYFENNLLDGENLLVKSIQEARQGALSLIENCIEQEFDFFQHQQSIEKRFPILKKYILEYKLFQQKSGIDSDGSLLKYLAEQRNFTTNSMKNLSLFQNLLKNIDGVTMINTLLEKNRLSSHLRHHLHLPNLLSFMAVLTQYHQDFHSKFYFELEQMIHENLENGYKKGFFVTMMICRQSCMEPNAKFKTYSHLYETFCACPKMLSCAKKTTSLLAFLSEMVPYEPYWTLRSHLAHQLQTTAQLRPLANDYYNLARCRMRDLESSSEMSAASKTLFSKEDLVENETKTMEVIWTSVQHFKSTGGKIPGNIYQLFNFKRPYFLTIFLPRLVKLSEKDSTAFAFLNGLKSSLKLTEKQLKVRP